MKKSISIVLVLLLMVSLFAGCSTPDVVATADGFTMSIPGHYTNVLENQQVEGVSMAYSFMDISILVIKEDYSLFEGGRPETTEAYAELVKEANNLPGPIEEVEGITTFRFTTEDDGVRHTSVAAVYMGTDAYYLLQMGCEENHFAVNQETFNKIITSVVVE